MHQTRCWKVAGACAAAMAVGAALSSCDTKAADRARLSVEQMFTRLAASAESQSNSWKAELQSWRTDLPKDLDEASRTILDERVPRILQASGVEVRGSVAFTGAYFGRELRKVGAALLGKPVPAEPPVPTLCTPMSVFRSSSNDQALTLVWDGWGFRESAPNGKKLMLRLFHSGTTDFTDYDVVSDVSEFVQVANLSKIPHPYSSRFDRIGLVWNESILSDIPILDAEPTPPRVIEVTLNAWGPLIAQLTSTSDREFAGHGPKMNWSVKLSIDDNKLWATVHYSALEWDSTKQKATGDETEARVDSAPIQVFAPTGTYQIVEITSSTEDSGTLIDSSHEVHRVQGQIYPIYDLYGDGPDSEDAGKFTRIAVTVTGKATIRVQDR